jgi:hypothetical protein
MTVRKALMRKGSQSMKRDLAACGATQCGLQLLEGSVPRLIRHAASGKQAGGEGCPSLPAGKDTKPSRGAGWNPAKLYRPAKAQGHQQAPAIKKGLLPSCIHGEQWPQATALSPAPCGALTRVYTRNGEPCALASGAGIATIGHHAAHQGSQTDASSRPCLTAGNLRHGDEVGERE